MGGGDLNLKKSWHPATLKNQERVWKEERKHSEEQKKIEQMKKELMEERQLQELQQLQEEAGQKKRSDRLDWMYAAPNQGAGKGNKDEMEEYLLGKRSVDHLIRDKNSKETVASSAAERFAISNSNANNERDIQAKIREDPLLMIKKREQQSLRAIIDNPLRMKELRKEKKDKKKKKKKESESKPSSRHHRHEEYSREERSRHRHRSRSPDRSRRYRSRSRTPERRRHRSPDDRRRYRN
ncbi:Pre-mRNA splicing factor-domain-containing protein [Fennellomyces sp. T-0311]|nr:Pre-mRNA splicing factor-domain-containing protein [Fennellomyces sp. T-0311]